MTRISLVATAHKIISGTLASGAIAVDATVGNGHDTLFLAQQVGVGGRVYGFDIQQTALDNTRARLRQSGLLAQVELIHDSHENFFEHIPQHHLGCIAAIMFNLGYLPGSDKNITTDSDSSLKAVSDALRLLQPGAGCLTIITYSGHPGGLEEFSRINDWHRHLDNKQFITDSVCLEYTRKQPPRLLTVKRAY